MSSELLDNIKQQITALTTQEKTQLAAFLGEQLRGQTRNGDEEDLEGSRLKRMAWLKAHRDQYGGQYVALEGDQLIAVGQSYRIAREKALTAGKPNALVTYLAKPEEVGEWGGWG